MFGEICSPSPREGLLTVPSGCPPARGAVGDAGAALPIPVPHPSQPKATGRDEDNHGVKTPGQAAAGTWSPGWAHRGDLPGSGSAPGKPKPPPHPQPGQHWPPTVGHGQLTRESSFPQSWRDPKVLHLFNLKT